MLVKAYVRHPAQCRGRSGRVGHPGASARRREGLQEVLADEGADEARGFGKDQPARQRGAEGFWLSCGPLERGIGTVIAQFWARVVMNVGCLVQKCFKMKTPVIVGA